MYTSKIVIELIKSTVHNTNCNDDFVKNIMAGKININDMFLSGCD